MSRLSTNFTNKSMNSLIKKAGPLTSHPPQRFKAPWLTWSYLCLVGQTSRPRMGALVWRARVAVQHVSKHVWLEVCTELAKFIEFIDVWRKAKWNVSFKIHYRVLKSTYEYLYYAYINTVYTYFSYDTYDDTYKLWFSRHVQYTYIHTWYIISNSCLHFGAVTRAQKTCFEKKHINNSTLPRKFHLHQKKCYLFQPQKKQPVVSFQGLSTNPLGFPLHLSKVFGYPGAQRLMDSMDAGESDHQKGKPQKNIWLFKEKSRKSWYKYQGCDLFWWFSCLLVLARNGCWYLFWGERMLKQPSLSPDCYTMYHCVTAYHVISL